MNGRHCDTFSSVRVAWLGRKTVYPASPTFTKCISLYPGRTDATHRFAAPVTRRPRNSCSTHFNDVNNELLFGLRPSSVAFSTSPLSVRTVSDSSSFINTLEVISYSYINAELSETPQTSPLNVKPSSCSLVCYPGAFYVFFQRAPAANNPRGFSGSCSGYGGYATGPVVPIPGSTPLDMSAGS